MLKGAEFCCCRALFSSLEESIFFLPRFKCFAFYQKADDYDQTGKLTWCFITHCPYCGSKLPFLVSEYLNILNKNCKKLLNQYGYSDEAIINFPTEYQTDEWWKKRGL